MVMVSIVRDWIHRLCKPEMVDTHYQLLAKQFCCLQKSPPGSVEAGTAAKSGEQMPEQSAGIIILKLQHHVLSFIVCSCAQLQDSIWC